MSSLGFTPLLLLLFMYVYSYPHPSISPNSSLSIIKLSKFEQFIYRYISYYKILYQLTHPLRKRAWPSSNPPSSSSPSSSTTTPSYDKFGWYLVIWLSLGLWLFVTASPNSSPCTRAAASMKPSTRSAASASSGRRPSR